MIEIPNIQDIPDDGSRQREVYAFAGLALFQAQVWERGMVNLALIMKRARGDLLAAEEWDSDEKLLTSFTAGGLRKHIEKEGLAPTTTLKHWKHTLKLRNSLAHGFFYRHAEHFMFPQGMQLMLNELGSMIDEFEIADEKSKEVIARVSKKWGITAEDMKKMEDELLQRAEANLEC